MGGGRFLVTVVSDASFCPDTGAAGWAVWVVGGGRRIKESGEFKAKMDVSNSAEMAAAINGMYYAIQSFGTSMHVHIVSDCTTVINAVQKGMKSSSRCYDMYKKLVDLQKENDLSLSAKHVKAHSGVQDRRSYVNRWCDERAREHMKQMRERLQKGSNA